MTTRTVLLILLVTALGLSLTAGALVVIMVGNGHPAFWPMVTVSGLGVAACGAGVILLERRIFLPARRLTEAFRRLARGEVDITLPHPPGQDEFGQMAGAFEEMTAYYRRTAEAAERVARGDLTTPLIPVSEKDELGKAFSRAVAHLRQVILQVNDSAARLSLAVEELNRAADQAGQVAAQMSTTSQQVVQGVSQQTDDINQTASAVEQIGRAIESVARGAQEQSSAVVTTYESVRQLSKAVEDVRKGAVEQVEQMRQAETALNNLASGQARVAQLSGEAFDEAGSASQTAADGSQIIAQAVEGIQEVKTAAEELAGRVMDLGQRSSQIGSVIGVIAEIATNTNLLSLNAAIEAARAGTQGKGFAVVAEEVRRLAIRTSRSTEQIKEMIEAMRATASEVSAAMEQAGSNVQNSVTLTNQAGEAFTAIVSATQGLANRIGAIQEAVKYNKNAGLQVRAVVAENITVAGRNQKASEDMAQVNNAVLASLDTVSNIVEQNTTATQEMYQRARVVTQAAENAASISEENSASMEQMSASARELDDQAKEVAESARQLADMARRLNELVASFKLK